MRDFSTGTAPGIRVSAFAFRVTPGGTLDGRGETSLGGECQSAAVAVPAARAIIEKNLGDEGKQMLEEFLKAVAEAGK